MPLSLSDALYDGPNRVIIDDNTPETNTLPVSGGKGVDEFLITLTANSVVIDDDSEANVIVFEGDAVITSIERQAGSEGASVAQYVITLSSGKTITLRNPASFTFQHLGDATRTDPISAEDFFTAYEDGFAASDASHPDIIGDASGPSGVQGPMITGTATGSVTEDDAGRSTATGTLMAPGQTIGLDGADNLGRANGTYGRMNFDAGSGVWTYTLNNNYTMVQGLGGSETLTETFTFTALGAENFAVEITITGTNDAPVVLIAQPFQNLYGRERKGEMINTIDLRRYFIDKDTNDELTLTVTLDDGAALDTIGLTYDGSSGKITGTFNKIGNFRVKAVANDGTADAADALTFTITVREPNDRSDAHTDYIVEDAFANVALGRIDGGIAALQGGNGVSLGPGLWSRETQYGKMTFYVNSVLSPWIYHLSNANEATQKLVAGQTVDEVFTFVTGRGTFDVIITIIGTNDAPVVATAIEPQSGMEGQEKVIDLSTLFSDIDTGGTLILSVAVELDGNEITFDGSRNIISNPNASKMLRITLASAGTYEVTVVADDGNGGRGSSSFNLEVEADTPPAIGIPGSEDRAGAGAVTEDGTLTATGVLEVTDVDNPQALPAIGLDGDGVGTYGTMTFDESSGKWTYTLAVTPEQGGKTQALTEGQAETETFTFTALGAENFAVEITITGTNDAPVVATAIEPQSGVEGQEKVIDLSTLFTDVDEGDELTFEVTLDDGAALSTIGLTYDSDEDEITGTLTGTGTYVIKIVATDKSGATVETTFDLNILSAIPEIQRSSLTYNPDETSITIDETMLEVTSNNQFAPTLLVYTITTLPDAGVLSKSGTQLNNGDAFTQADINNGLITYVPSVSGSSTSQSNPLSFTFSDGVETLEEEQTLQITSREVFENAAPAEDNEIDQSIETTPQKIEAGDGSDIITGGAGDDQIDGGAGDDEIILTRTVNNVEEDAGADEVLYTFGYDGVGIDGGDKIVGFKRGQDKVTFVVQDSRQFANLEEFLGSLKGADDENLTANDAFIVTMQWETDEAGAFYFDGVLLHFKDASVFGGGRVSSPLVQITFDERLDLNDLIEILGGAEKAADNFDFTHAAFKNLDEVLPRLFGESSIDFVVLPFSNSISVPDDATPPSQNLIGDDNIQTLNYGASGNLIFGGRGDDIINLGDGRDDVYYRYDGVDDSDSAAFDGGDVINNFDLDEDLLLLYHAEGNIHDDLATFFDAIKGVSLLDSGGKITGIVFTFIDRAEGADDDDEIDLTVNLENDDFISSEDIDLTAFNEVEIGKWTIKTDQETAAYETIIDDVLHSALRLSSFFIVSGYGVNGVTIGDEAATSSQYLLGGDNVQTLNAGTGGDDIVGGKGDDIINLGDGVDYIFYHYDGADKTDSAAYDGGDVINNFDLDRDQLRLRHVGNNVHSSTAEFYAAIKGVSLLVGVINGDEIITGIVFTFTDRDTPTEEIDLTVNFENADFIFPEITALTAFNEEVSGRRTIKTGQEIAAYQVIDAVLDNNLYLYNFARHKPPSPSQILIGDDNIQTLNYGAAGNLIFGGKGDDIINLGNGADFVYYRYDGVDESDYAAFDGGDVINNFDLDEDLLRLFHAEGNIHLMHNDDDITTFFDAIKGVSLLDSGGKITGIVFTFIDRAEGANDDDETDLTVNLENDDFISSEDIDLTAFNEEVSGRRTIKTGQETAAYQTIIDDVFRSALNLSSSFIVSGYGVNGVTIGDEAATSSQFLIGGNNAQTLNAGTGGDVIFGGKDDDIINLGGGYDSIFYGYDGADKTDSAAYDGGDVINNFDLDEDALILEHVGNNVHSSTAEFYAAIKGVSLLVGVNNHILLVEENKILYEDEAITGIVFTFTDRDAPTEEIDLTVNFENADFIFPEITDLTAFNEEVSGRRTIKTGQEDAAYEVIDAIFVGTLSLYNFGSNAPEVFEAIGTQRGTVDRPITAIDLGYIFYDYEDGFELTLTVTLDDGTALSTIGLTYDSDEDEITGTLTRTGTYVIKIVATDRSGATVETTFEIVVAEGQVVIEDSGEGGADPEINGTIGLTDPTPPNNLQGIYGALTFDAATKTWTYTLNNTSALVQALAEGQTKEETFTFTDATAGSGATEDVVITVVGANDAPVITASGAVSVQDGETSFASDVLTIVDVDDGDLAKLTSGSFTLTAGAGATAAIVNKFEVVQDTNGRWQLALKSGQSFVLADAATFVINVSVTDAGDLSDNVDVTFNVAPARTLVDTNGSDIVGTAFEGDLSTSGDIDVNSDVTLASTAPFTISTQGTYGTASIDDDGEWVYTLDNGNADVRALNSGETLTDTFVVNVTATDGAQTQIITITINGRTDVLGTNAGNSSLGDASTADHQAIFGFNSADTLTGGLGNDLLVGGYGADTIDLSAGGTDTVVYRINSSDTDGFVKAEDGGDTVMEFTPGEDKLVILDINETTPTTFTGLFDSLTGGAFQLGISGDTDGDFVLSSTELDNGARAFMYIVFEADGTPDGGSGGNAGRTLKIVFNRVTSEALNDRAVWDTLTGGTDFSSATIPTVALLSSLFGGFGRPGYDAALDDGGFISIIGPDDLPDSYFEFA